MNRLKFPLRVRNFADKRGGTSTRRRDRLTGDLQRPGRSVSNEEGRIAASHAGRFPAHSQASCQEHSQENSEARARAEARATRLPANAVEATRVVDVRAIESAAVHGHRPVTREVDGCLDRVRRRLQALLVADHEPLVDRLRQHHHLRVGQAHVRAADRELVEPDALRDALALRAAEQRQRRGHRALLAEVVALVGAVAEQQPGELFVVGHVRLGHQLRDRRLHRAGDRHARLDLLVAPHRQNVDARIRHRPVEREKAVLDVELAAECRIAAALGHAHVAHGAQRHARRAHGRDGARKAEIRALPAEAEVAAEIDVDVRARRKTRRGFRRGGFVERRRTAARGAVGTHEHDVVAERGRRRLRQIEQRVIDGEFAVDLHAAQMPAVGDARAARERQAAVGRGEQFELVGNDVRREIGVLVVETHAARRAQRAARAVELDLLEVDQIVRQRDMNHAVLQLHALIDHRRGQPVADQRTGQVGLRDRAAQRELQREVTVEQIARTEQPARGLERRHVRLDRAAERRFVHDREYAVARRKRGVRVDVDHAHAARLRVRRERQPVAAAEGRAHVDVAETERGEAATDFHRDVAAAAFELHVARGRRPDREVPVAVEHEVGLERRRLARELLAQRHHARHRDVGERARRADPAVIEIETLEVERRALGDDARRAQRHLARARAQRERRLHREVRHAAILQLRDGAVPARAFARVGELAVGGHRQIDRLALQLALRAGRERVMRARAREPRGEAGDIDARHGDVARIRVEGERAVRAIARFGVPLRMANAVVAEHDVVELVVERDIGMREGAGQIAVRRHLARDAETEPVELRRVDLETQTVAARAEAALQIDGIARHGQIRAARQDARARELDQARARERQVVVDARPELELGLGRERGREHAGGRQRAVHARLDAAVGGARRGFGLGRRVLHVARCVIRGVRCAGLHGLFVVLDALLRLRLLAADLRGIQRRIQRRIEREIALGIQRIAGRGRLRRVALRALCGLRGLRRLRRGFRRPRSRRRLRGRHERERIEVRERRLQRVAGIRVVLERARQVDVTRARSQPHVVEREPRRVLRDLALQTQRGLRIGEIERDALRVAVQTHADRTRQLRRQHARLDGVEVEARHLEVEAPIAARQRAAARDRRVLDEPHVQIREALRLGVEHDVGVRVDQRQQLLVDGARLRVDDGDAARDRETGRVAVRRGGGRGNRRRRHRHRHRGSRRSDHCTGRRRRHGNRSHRRHRSRPHRRRHRLRARRRPTLRRLHRLQLRAQREVGERRAGRKSLRIDVIEGQRGALQRHGGERRRFHVRMARELHPGRLDLRGERLERAAEPRVHLHVLAVDLARVARVARERERFDAVEFRAGAHRAERRIEALDGGFVMASVAAAMKLEARKFGRRRALMQRELVHLHVADVDGERQTQIVGQRHRPGRRRVRRHDAQIDVAHMQIVDDEAPRLAVRHLQHPLAAEAIDARRGAVAAAPGDVGEAHAARERAAFEGARQLAVEDPHGRAPRVSGAALGRQHAIQESRDERDQQHRHGNRPGQRFPEPTRAARRRGRVATFAAFARCVTIAIFVARRFRRWRTAARRRGHRRPGSRTGGQQEGKDRAHRHQKAIPSVRYGRTRRSRKP
ncbi:hypothetical protein PT2222_90249 [Paraburkholderia tropica]